MKVFVLNDVLCDYTCGCIVVAAEYKEEAIDIILRKHGQNICDDIEEAIEEVGPGYYLEVWGGS